MVASIQAEVGKLLKDLRLLDERVGKLASHFLLSQKDVDKIVTSTNKIAKRGDRIVDMEFDAPAAEAVTDETPERPQLRAVESGGE